MRCVNCDNEIRDGSRYCTICGADQTRVEDRTSAARLAVSNLKLPTNRSAKKMILFTLLTFGVYGLALRIKMSEELNIVVGHSDGEHTTSFLLIFLLTRIFPLAMYPWYHAYCNRIGNELKRRGCAFSFGAGDYWRWSVLGSFILVGPLVFLYREMKAMNLLNEHYNLHGSVLRWE